MNATSRIGAVRPLRVLWSMINRRCLVAAIALVSNIGVSAADHVGFFSPQGINAELVAHTNFAMINVQSVKQLRDSLILADGHPFAVSLDFGPVLAAIAAPGKLPIGYTTTDGMRHSKQLTPTADNKIRVLPADQEIEKLLKPYLDEMQKHTSIIDTVFLVDEPYLNGIPKKELERAGKEVRRLLRRHGLPKAKLGVIFASAMFDPDFAAAIDRAAGDYAQKIDHHYLTGGTGARAKAVEEWVAWKKTIAGNRLTTYDSAGNMYTGGGIPSGFDVVAFDFYLSTVLLDGVHEKTLSWFASRYPKQCGLFNNTSMSELRKQLSFFHNGPVLQGDGHRGADRKLLDSMFSCRMGAAADLLQKQIDRAGGKSNSIQPLLIAESSNNGVLEFDANGNIESNQPDKLNESRVFDEVVRGLTFYRENRTFWTGGLMFFTYQDEYDSSIKMRIGGAKSMPSVLAKIYNH